MPESPEVVAVIDVGSNSIRMEIAELTAGGVTVLERVQRTVRLGRDTFSSGSLKPATIRAAVDVFRDYRRLLDSLGAARVRAVATSAVREARNSDTLIDRVELATGMRIEVIDPLEEGRIIVAAMIDTLPPRAFERALAVEVGGGGTLMTFLEGGRVEWARTFGLGSVRLPQSLGTAGMTPLEAARLLGRQARNALETLEIPDREGPPVALVFLGADARLAAREIGTEEGPGLWSVQVQDLRTLVMECAGMSVPELMRRFGLSPAEAETLVPALQIVSSVASRLRRRRLHVSDATMRDGMLSDLLMRAAGQAGLPSGESTVRSAVQVATRYGSTPAQFESVARYALEIFDALPEVHGLGPRDRLLLEVAAVLHETGRFVDERSHHKHSLYLISNSEVFGLNREELLDVAHVARYHRRSAPRTSHLEYMALSADRRRRISKLAAILRVACALDSQKPGHARQLSFHRRGDDLYVAVGGADDVAPEQRALSSLGDMFEDVYGLKVRIAAGQGAVPPPPGSGGEEGHLTRHATLRTLSAPGAGGSLPGPELFINRELSWLDFDRRVLAMGGDPGVPLLERLRFLSISASNLDEFFMIRVAGLMQQAAAGLRRRDPSGLTPREQLRRVRAAVRVLLADHERILGDVLSGLRGSGLTVLRRSEWTEEHRLEARARFESEILPLLTPLALDRLDPVPLLPGLAVNAAVLGRDGGLTVASLPSQLHRLVRLPGWQHTYVLLEDMALENADLISGGPVEASFCFRLTRDADVEVDDDDAQDLLAEVESAVLSRRRRGVVRVEVTASPREARRRLLALLSAEDPGMLYETATPGMASISDLLSVGGFDELRYPAQPPVRPADLGSGERVQDAVETRDILMIHPYESFDPVVELLQWAASDPSVLAVKQTLYRTGSGSPVVSALAEAARAGRMVTVLVELKARFDEQRNAGWARMLEEAGCQVIYGVAGLKTHAKALLVVSRENGRIRRRVHLSTGNYNVQTARLYSDAGLMTSDPAVCSDVAEFFNLLTGRSDLGSFRTLCIAPSDMKRRIVELLEREAMVSSPDRPGLVMAKLNSIQDPDIISAVYRASAAGVRVRLNVRGICCLRPGVPGVSENVEVVSVVDRYLEHSRILVLANGGAEEVYLSSADWMTRNLERRMEVLFQVREAAHRRRLRDFVEAFFRDRARGWTLRPDGTWSRLAGGAETPAQEYLYREAAGTARED